MTDSEISEHNGHIDHVEINVSDLAKSVKFWEYILKTLGYVEYQNWSKGRSWILGNTYIVMVQVDKKYMDIKYHRKAVGLNHLAFSATVNQIQEIRKYLMEMKATLIYEDRFPHAGAQDEYSLFFEDPDRIKAEIVSRNRKTA
jgi:catechol 2,3-dioxygenase-like lactoylglutathione lyase family enzyme